MIKWEACRSATGSTRYVVCNADEGEPGTFKDRVLLASRADLVFDGMTVAAIATGATRGMLYLRGEYAFLREALEQVLERRRRDGLLGAGICGSALDFDIEVHLGAGAYVCGEETALLESLEGKRGVPRNRPPYPVTCERNSSWNRLKTSIATPGTPAERIFSVVELRYRWKMGARVEPDYPLHQGYVVNVRGRPNVEFTLKHSMPHGEVAHTPEEGMQMNLITTALPAINAIPAVCAAPTGIRTYADLPLISGAGFVVS